MAALAPALVIGYTLTYSPKDSVSALAFLFDEPLFFVDEMRFGPYRFWHHQHRFIKTTEGIKMQDTVYYAFKFGWLGQILHNMVIRTKLNDIFDYRQTALEAIFESRR